MNKLLSCQLLRRGFLVETYGPDIYLSDNAYLKKSNRRPEKIYLENNVIPYRYVSIGADSPIYEDRYQWERPLSDHEVLGELLRRINCGQVVPTGMRETPFRLTCRDHVLDDCQINEFFRWPIVLSEAFVHEDQKTPAWFKENPMTRKMPLAIFESHIAILVKALSAVGCGIWSSCEGHEGRRYPRCELTGPISALWARQILRHASQAGYGGLGVIRRHKRFSIVTDYIPRKPANLINLRKAQRKVTAIGAYIYQNRFELRNMRSKWLTNSKPVKVEHEQFTQLDFVTAITTTS